MLPPLFSIDDPKMGLYIVDVVDDKREYILVCICY